MIRDIQVNFIHSIDGHSEMMTFLRVRNDLHTIDHRTNIREEFVAVLRRFFQRNNAAEKFQQLINYQFVNNVVFF